MPFNQDCGRQFTWDFDCSSFLLVKVCYLVVICIGNFVSFWLLEYSRDSINDYLGVIYNYHNQLLLLITNNYLF